MPIELEFKFILRDAEQLWAKLSPTTHSNLIVGQAAIEQAYLSKGGRIRKRTWSRYWDNHDLGIERIFTYKHKLSSQPGCLEIETEMSDTDFNLAWSEADHKITKTRFLLHHLETKNIWEFDFFHDDDGIYLALAELEVPANSGPPDRLHPLVEEYLIYRVPTDDSRFTNRKLCDRKKVMKLLKEIA